MSAEILFAFNKSDADGLVQLLKAKNGRGSNTVSAPEPANCLVGVAITTISARAGTTLGSGSVQAKYIDDSDVLQNYRTFNVLNPGSAIANGSYVLLFRSGRNWLAVEVC